MATASPTRVNYYDRQFLQAADLTTDQDYHRQARWRHNLALHSWGVLAGLDVTVVAESTNTAVVRARAGMAIDGYGRELVVPVYVEKRDTLDKDQSYDLWLVYGEESPAPAVRGWDRTWCDGPDRDPRTRETPRLAVSKTAARQSADISRPDGVPPADLDFRASRPAPAAPTPWPVFLAKLSFAENLPPPTEGAAATSGWQIDISERRYAGLTAERIVAPPTTDKGQSTTVFVGSYPNDPGVTFAVQTQEGTPTLAVRDTGDQSAIELHAARVTVAGDFVLRGGSALEFVANSIATSTANTPALAGSEHWRIYHHFEPPAAPEPTTPPPSPPAGTPSVPPPVPASYSDELRITMPSSPPGTNRVAIGRFTDKGKFEPVLVVKDENVVEVYGTLQVSGEILGRRTKLPPGTAVGSGGGIDETKLLNQVGDYLKLANFPDRFENIVGKVHEVATDGDKAIAAFGSKLAPTAVVDIAGNIWTATATATETFAKTFPSDKDKPALKGIAKGLVTTNTPGLEALVHAIIEADPDAVMNVLANNHAAAVAKGLVSNSKDVEMIDALFASNHRTANFKRVGGVLDAGTAIPADVTEFLKGANKTATLAELAKGLFDVPTKGNAATASAWIDGLPQAPATTQVPQPLLDSRLGSFFQHVKQKSLAGSASSKANYANLLQSLTFLGDHFNDL